MTKEKRWEGNLKNALHKAFFKLPEISKNP